MYIMALGLWGEVDPAILQTGSVKVQIGQSNPSDPLPSSPQSALVVKSQSSAKSPTVWTSPTRPLLIVRSQMSSFLQQEQLVLMHFSTKPSPATYAFFKCKVFVWFLEWSGRSENPKEDLGNCGSCSISLFIAKGGWGLSKQRAKDEANQKWHS